MRSATNDKIPCLSCGRLVKDDPQAKVSHIMRYHRDVPIRRLCGMFNPSLFEHLGYRIGERLKAML